MKTLKTTLLISMLILLTTSCTDLTKDDLVPETNNNTEILTSITDLANNDKDGSNNGDTNNGGTTNNNGGTDSYRDTGGGSDGGGDDGSKGN